MKTPLILLPGLLCDEALWRHQLSGLADVADMTVADMTQDDTIAGMVRRMLAAAPAKFAACGLSMGGYAAMELMRQAPERVAKLALLDTSARADTPDRTAARRQLIDRAKSGGFADVVEEHLPNFVHPSRYDDPDIMPVIRASAMGVGAEAYVRQQTAIIARPDSLPGLSAIKCPTLVLCGKEDALTPLALHEEIAAAIPGAKLAVVAGSGHLAPLEMPDETNTHLRAWLAGA